MLNVISTLLSSANDKLPAKIYLSKHYSPIMLYISQKYLIFWFWISERYQKDWSVDVYGHKCLSCHGQYFKSIIAIGQLGTHETMRPWDSFRPQVYLVPIKAYSGIFFRYSLNGQKKTIKSQKYKMPECRTHRYNVFAVIYAKHKIAIKSRSTIT